VRAVRSRSPELPRASVVVELRLSMGAARSVLVARGERAQRARVRLLGIAQPLKQLLQPASPPSLTRVLISGAHI
jgi:hypothetical protein